MKYGALLYFILLFNGYITAQKQYNIWYFGINAGLSFNTNPPQALTDGKVNSLESSSGISDANGNLLFYTDGDTVYNRAHQIMKNGLLKYYRRNSSMQGSIVVPVPNSTHLYYIFTTQANEYRDSNRYLRYSIIDMDGDNKMGEIVVKDVPILPNPGEGIALTKHANGTDIWVATIDIVNKQFLSVRTVNGIIDMNTKVSQSVDPAFDTLNNIFKTHKFSLDGKIFRGMHYSEYVNNQYKSYFGLYKFDNATGMISDYLKIPFISYGSIVFEFSPDSRFLYCPDGNAILQYDLTDWDKTKILSSAVSITPSNQKNVSGIQMGPDGKLYVFHTPATPGPTRKKLSVIQAPNRKGTLCNFVADAIDLNGKSTYWGGPYYPTCFFKFPELSVVANKNTTICKGDTLTLTCETKASAILWNTGEQGTTIKVTQPGIYWAKAIINDSTYIDSISVTIGEKFKVYLGPDTGFCSNFLHLLNAGAGAKSYMWNTGDTTVTKFVYQPGMYAVTIKDSNSCKNADTIFISKLKDPIISINKDTMACKVRLTVAPENGTTYLWNTGDTTTAITVNQKGTYSLKASSQFCDLTKQVSVNETFDLTIQLGADTNYCGNFQRLLDAGKGTAAFLWNTGETTPTKLVSQPGIYVATKKYSNACKASDTITITQVKEPEITVETDTVNCKIILSVAPQAGVNYLWSTGEKSERIQVDKKGEYTLKAKTQHCSFTKQSNVDKLLVPEVTLSNDTSICETPNITIGVDTKNGYNYVWNTGETTPVITVNKGGNYQLTVSQYGCKITNTITVWDSCDMQYFIPNAFTPTGDYLNEVFAVSGIYIREVDMQIFSRWGEKLYDAKGKSPAWDGTSKNVVCPEGVYIFLLKVSGKQKGKPVTFYLRGNVTLRR